MLGQTACPKTSSLYTRMRSGKGGQSALTEDATQAEAARAALEQAGAESLDAARDTW